MGVPMLGCNCRVCRSDDPRDKRLRASVWIQTRGKHLIIDTGIDFRQQALRAGIPTVDAVLFTHHHVDHIFGLDEVRPFTLQQKKAVTIFCSHTTCGEVKRVYQYIFQQEKPESDIPQIIPVTFDDRPFRFADISIQPIPVFHGKLPINGFRIGSFAYITDVSAIPEPSYSLLKGVDVLVLGALRHRPHPTHFTIDQAVEAARRIGARQTFLTHMSHGVSHRELVQSLPSTIAPAYDGLRIETEP